MAGYHGYSMSNNAVEAYDRGLMPRSKWTKSDILDELTDLLKGEEAKAKIEVLAKMPTEKVRSYCLNYKERHHTGKYYNYTDFYEVDIDAVNELTLTELQERLSSIERQKAERREAKKGQQRHQKQSLLITILPPLLNSIIGTVVETTAIAKDFVKLSIIGHPIK